MSSISRYGRVRKATLKFRSGGVGCAVLVASAENKRAFLPIYYVELFFLRNFQDA